MSYNDDIDFPNIAESEGRSFTLIPKAQYLVVVADVLKTSRDGTLFITKRGDNYWRLDLQIEYPEYYKGCRVFDRVFFSEEALPRLKMISKRCGVDVTKKYSQDALRDELIGRTVYVDIDVESYLQDGLEKKRNIILFGGYYAVEDVEKNTFSASKAALQEKGDIDNLTKMF